MSNLNHKRHAYVELDFYWMKDSVGETPGAAR
jgi:hypothetical protein